MSIRSIRNSSIKQANTIDNAQPISFDCEYAIIAGGSGGGGGRIGASAYSGEYYNGGGGGAGGYHTNVTGDLSGEDTTVENPMKVFLGFNYFIQVGAGGAQATGGEAAAGRGTESKFELIVMEEGGRGQARNGGGSTGGCGGGRGGGIYGGSSHSNNVAGQGFRGGWSDQGGPNNYTFGGGGGVSERGGNTSGDTFSGVTGGAGIVSTILTSSEASTASVGEVDSGSVYFGGGGGAGNLRGSPPWSESVWCIASARRERSDAPRRWAAGSSLGGGSSAAGLTRTSARTPPPDDSRIRRQTIGQVRRSRHQQSSPTCRAQRAASSCAGRVGSSARRAGTAPCTPRLTRPSAAPRGGSGRSTPR